MKWFLDVGHSRIKHGVHDGGRWVCLHALSARPPWTDLSVDQKVSEIWLASVRDQNYNHALKTFLAKSHSCTPRFAHARAAWGNGNSLYKAEQLGVDRFLAVLAAHQQTAAAVVVVDCGTALTVDAVDDAGCHRGGLIMPGAESLRMALRSEVGLSFSKKAGGHGCLALDTSAAVNQGCSLMLSAAAAAAAKAMQKELHSDAVVMVTGGDADLLNWPEELSVCPNPQLVLDGLCLYVQKIANDESH